MQSTYAATPLAKRSDGTRPRALRGVQLVPTQDVLQLLPSVHGARTRAWLNANDIRYLAGLPPAEEHEDAGAAAVHFMCSMPISVFLALWRSGRGQDAAGDPLVGPNGALVMVSSKALAASTVAAGLASMSGMLGGQPQPILSHVQPVYGSTHEEQEFPHETAMSHVLETHGIDFAAHGAPTVTKATLAAGTDLGLQQRVRHLAQKWSSDFAAFAKETQAVENVLRAVGGDAIFERVAEWAEHGQAGGFEGTMEVVQDVADARESANNAATTARFTIWTGGLFALEKVGAFAVGAAGAVGGGANQPGGNVAASGLMAVLLTAVHSPVLMGTAHGVVSTYAGNLAAQQIQGSGAPRVVREEIITQHAARDSPGKMLADWLRDMQEAKGGPGQPGLFQRGQQRLILAHAADYVGGIRLLGLKRQVLEALTESAHEAENVSRLDMAKQACAAAAQEATEQSQLSQQLSLLFKREASLPDTFYALERTYGDVRTWNDEVFESIIEAGNAAAAQMVESQACALWQDVARGLEAQSQKTEYSLKKLHDALERVRAEADAEMAAADQVNGEGMFSPTARYLAACAEILKDILQAVQDTAHDGWSSQHFWTMLLLLTGFRALWFSAKLAVFTRFASGSGAGGGMVDAHRLVQFAQSQLQGLARSVGHALADKDDRGHNTLSLLESQREQAQAAVDKLRSMPNPNTIPTANMRSWLEEADRFRIAVLGLRATHAALAATIWQVEELQQAVAAQMRLLTASEAQQGGGRLAQASRRFLDPVSATVARAARAAGSTRAATTVRAAASGFLAKATGPVGRAASFLWSHMTGGLVVKSFLILCNLFGKETGAAALALAVDMVLYSQTVWGFGIQKTVDGAFEQVGLKDWDQTVPRFVASQESARAAAASHQVTPDESHTLAELLRIDAETRKLLDSAELEAVEGNVQTLQRLRAERNIAHSSAEIDAEVSKLMSQAQVLGQPFWNRFEQEARKGTGRVAELAQAAAAHVTDDPNEHAHRVVEAVFDEQSLRDFADAIRSVATAAYAAGLRGVAPKTEKSVKLAQAQVMLGKARLKALVNSMGAAAPTAQGPR